MLFAKYKYTLTISAGTVSSNTDTMMGMIEQITVTPATSTTVWDLTLTDRDGDIVYQRLAETGTVNDRTAWVPIGRDSSEKLTMAVANASANETIKVIFKVREKH